MITVQAMQSVPRKRSVLFTLALGVFFVFLQRAFSPKVVPIPSVLEPGTRTDRHGDALPPGAVARLGTVRFRHQTEITHLAFSADSRTLVSQDCAGTLVVWQF